QGIATNDPNHPASQGSKVVVLNLNNLPPQGSVRALLSQTVVTIPGQRYGLAFDVGTVNAIVDQRVRVRLEGSGVLLDQVITFAGPTTGAFYIPQHVSFVANSTNTKLTFTDESFTPMVVDSLLDNIQITAESPDLPLVVSQPQRAAAPVGGQATFAVGATAPGPVSYQWQFN